MHHTHRPDRYEEKVEQSKTSTNKLNIKIQVTIAVYIKQIGRKQFKKKRTLTVNKNIKSKY